MFSRHCSACRIATCESPAIPLLPSLPALVRRSEPQEIAMTDFKYSLSNLKPVESSKVALTFPDGATREFPKDTTGLQIAKGMSPSLAKRNVAMTLEGLVTDLAEHIEL